MNIVPISGAIQGLPQIGGGPNIIVEGQDASKSFTDYLKDAVENIDKLDEAKSEDAYNLAVGNVDNLAAIQINSQKYEIAVQLMVQMRNKFLDSYSEIMRMNI